MALRSEVRDRLPCRQNAIDADWTVYEDAIADPTLRLIARSVRERCSEFDEPYWAELNESGNYPSDFIASLIEGGWFSLILPKRYNGCGLGLRAAAVVLFELSSNGGGLNAAMPLHTAMLSSWPIIKHGSASVRDALLPALGTNQLIPCLAVTEHAAGADLQRIQTLAVRRGNQWFISGLKSGVAQARQANFALILARTLDSTGTNDVSLFGAMLDRERIHVDVYNGHPHGALPNCDIQFREVPTPRSHLIGSLGQGLPALAEARAGERIHLAAIMVGIGTAVLKCASREIAIQHSLTSHNIEAIRHSLARSSARLSSAWAATLAAAAAMDKGHGAQLLAIEANYSAMEACYEAADAAMQSSGGFAFRPGSDIARFANEARHLRFAIWDRESGFDMIARQRLGLIASR